MPPARGKKKAGDKSAEAELAALVHSQSPAELLPAAHDPALTEDLALTLLRRRDIGREVIESLAKNSSVNRLRAVQNGIARHPHTPRHVSIPLIRRLYTVDLMEIALTPGVIPDVKRMAEDVIMMRLEALSLGERTSLGRRASNRVAGALLSDADPLVIAAALANPRMNEGAILKALGAEKCKAILVEAVIASERWSVARDIRMVLLRVPFTPFAKVIEYARSLPPSSVRDAMRYSRQPENVRTYVTALVEK